MTFEYDASGFLLPPKFTGPGKLIYLTREYIAIVDPQDAHLASHNWYVNFANRHLPYARNRALGYLHREIVQPPDKFVVDHADGNTLDCRRHNLRIATGRQNSGNYSGSGETGLRGVYRRGNRFRARIMTPDGRKSLGGYATKEEAAIAYDTAAREVFGEFAWVNVTAAPHHIPEEDIPF